jgi:uncharacterized protein DUF6084
VEADTAARQGPIAATGGPLLGLDFSVESARTLEFAAVPTLAFGLRVASSGERAVRSILLHVQVQIAARQRSYEGDEKDRLLDLFGEPARYGTTLRTLPWLRETRVVPGFEHDTLIDLEVPCTYDFEVTAAKYIAALGEGGDVPLEFLFSGTAFYAAQDGRLQTSQIGWDKEAEYKLPVRVWRGTMDRHFPGSAWLRLSRDTFDRLSSYRVRQGLPTWDEAFESLLERGQAQE